MNSMAEYNLTVSKAQRTLSRVILALILTTTIALTVTPWQQNVSGTGRVIAYHPEERPQNIEATVEGRISKWYVVEGSTVKKGDPIVDLADNDPAIIERLQQERTAATQTISASERRVKSTEDRIRGLELVLNNSVTAARARVQMSIDRVAAAEQSLQAARAALTTARLQIDRQKGLAAKGLTSTRNVELAELDLQQKTAELERAQAALNAAKSEKLSLDAELLRTDSDAQSRIDETWATHASAASDVAKAQGELTKIEVRLAKNI
ncbi:MAG: biotin/lipoyl-binding protein [Acidobacteria bacterium]|nr:biotin/lipoyl-binding protein [Acidobacteriota bacterium]